MIKICILQQVTAALRLAAPDLNSLEITPAILSALRLERPRNPEHGDYALNVSFLAKLTKMPPPRIAEIIHAHMPPGDQLETSVIGGYLNFTLTETLLRQTLATLIQNPNPGHSNSMAQDVILLEYVSANPTGPLHIGHGRWAALGDSLVRLFRHCQADVTAEFYINDFGFQMEKLALSLWWRSVDQLKNEDRLSGIAPNTALLEGRELPYPGEFVVELATDYLKDAAQQSAILEDWNRFQSAQAPNDITALPEWQTIKNRIIDIVAPRILATQQALLSTMRVPFDVWTSEKQELHASGAVERTLATLKQQGHSYEQDGALWFRSSTFGDEKDRVLKKSDGSYTYLAADIAYHDAKFLRPSPSGKPYNRILNIWGADHHGYIARMRGAIDALGHNPEQFEVLLGQLVNLIIEGERTRMGKRRKMLTLQDVIEEVGIDATRFWMVSKSADSTLDFDVDLAASASSDNPVFYVQYAHARCCSIFRNATEPANNIETGAEQPPYIQPEALHTYETKLTADGLASLFTTLPEERERAVLKAIIAQLDCLEETVRDAARLRSPHFLTQYLMDVAANFHSFYNICRILTPEPAVTQSRLMLVRAIQKTLKQGLTLIGVEAPEKM